MPGNTPAIAKCAKTPKALSDFNAATLSFFLVRHSGCVFDTLNDLYRLDDHDSCALVLGEGFALSWGSEDLHD
jgi:hypothetical protein